MNLVTGHGIATDLTQAARWLGLLWDGPATPFAGVAIDSRRVRPGSLFVALHGPNHDAHDYLGQAAAAGVAAALVERRMPVQLPQLVVDSTLLALGRLAAAWRARLALPLVAITGSNGKTTVKEMLAAILAAQGPVLATRGNLNNDIGVPLTLLELEPGHRWAVVEMGANHAGEIAYLAALARPQVAVVNNAGAAHLEGFGSLEGVARAKGEIYGGLDDNGSAVINADDRFAGLWRELAAGRRRLTFGLEQAADVHATWRSGAVASRIELTTPGGSAAFELPQPGRHNVMNALAACAAAHALGVAPAAMATALGGFGGVQGRLQTRIGRAGVRVMDDTYNANPSSLAVALSVLEQCPGRRVLVLGDMGELGAEGETLLRRAGEAARAHGVERLFTLGTASRAACIGFGAGAEHFDDLEALGHALAPLLDADTTILIKGSRAMRMERVVALLGEGDD